MSTMNDVHQFRVRTPSFLISADIPVQMNVVQQAQLYVDQLRREASKTRINVSEAVLDMKDYVTQAQTEDCLVTGFSSHRPNPFREKASCCLV